MVAWHEDKCGIEKLTDFLLTIEQHIFFLMYIKLVATLALSMPENLTRKLREAALGASTQGGFLPRSEKP